MLKLKRKQLSNYFEDCCGIGSFFRTLVKKTFDESMLYRHVRWQVSNENKILICCFQNTWERFLKKQESLIMDEGWITNEKSFRQSFILVSNELGCKSSGVAQNVRVPFKVECGAPCQKTSYLIISNFVFDNIW